MRKKVVVTSNDPTEPRAELEVSATLEIALETDPPFVDFGALDPGAAAVQSIKLTGHDAPTTKVTSVRIDPMGPRRPDVDPIVLAEVGEGSPASVELSVRPDAPEGRFYALVTIETDHPTVRVLKMRALGQIGEVMTIRRPSAAPQN